MKVKIVLPNRKEKPVLFKYRGQHQPQRAYLEIDPSQCTKYIKCRADYSGEIGNAVPVAVWHDLVFRIPVAPEVWRKGLKDLEQDERFISLTTRLVDSWEEIWNGNNYVGKHDRDTYDMLCHYVWETTNASLWGN